MSKPKPPLIIGKGDPITILSNHKYNIEDRKSTNNYPKDG